MDEGENRANVNRRDVPLYGLVEDHVQLHNDSFLPDEAEFYVVVQGSRLTHVTAAKKGGDGQTLSFVVPGHNLSEVVSITPYFCSENHIEPCGPESSLQYVNDIAQDIAQYLGANRDQLSPQSYRDVQKIFNMRTQRADVIHDCWKPKGLPRQIPNDEEALRLLDERITQAMSNMVYPPLWTDSENQPRQSNETAADLEPKETILHLAVRFGLVHLSQFVIHQPKGQRALTLPNQDGYTPLQLAQKEGRHAMFRILTATPGPVTGVQCVWFDNSSMLRFCPKTDSLILTEQQKACSSHQSCIRTLRDQLKDHSTLKRVTVLKTYGEGDQIEKGHCPNGKDLKKELQVEETVLLNNVFEEQLVLSLDDDSYGEECPSSISVNEHPLQSRADHSQCTEVAGDSLLLVNASNDQEVTSMTEGFDADIKCKIAGVTRSSTRTDSRLWETGDASYLPVATDTPPPYADSNLPQFTPDSQVTANLYCPSSAELVAKSDSSTMDSLDLSPSLVALEMNSEDDSTEPMSPFSPFLPDGEKSEDKLETFSPFTTLSCTRSQSASSYEHTSKEVNQDIRFRSYSYSSSKIRLRPGRFNRDVSPEQRTCGISEQSHEKREISFLKRAQSSAADEGSLELVESLQHLTLSEFLKEIEEEELDKGNTPAKVASEKHKVIRTFSFLKNRMSTTRNKSKGKKEREAKDRQLNGHRFDTGSCLGPTVCVVCDKPATGKDFLHCSICTAIVHKGCKESVPPCLKPFHNKYAVSMVKNKTASLPQNFTVRESPHPPAVIPKETNNTGPLSCPLSGSTDRLSENSETESDHCNVTNQPEDLLTTLVSSTSTDSSFAEDCVDAHIFKDILADAADYEAESWSSTVDHKFCKKQDKRAIKRQDVIYELMQTEIHHLQTLHIMAEVFRRGMKEEVQLDADAVERVFPCLDHLLLFHHAFFSALKERRQNSEQPQGQRNYLIQRIGDVLLQQFSDENGKKMAHLFGEFCSHHNEAVSFFKELQQNNKKFQIFIKQQGTNHLVRRREIPECILLVTQRITKYPVLLERILQYTQGGTEEHADLSKALAQIREVIAAVDLRVSKYEQQQRLQEVWTRMENRSSTKLKNGHTFRKQDMIRPGQTLIHHGILLWKTATGRLKDVLALLLTDTLILLQEKDQKFVFAAVDQKPPVIALQKLIVREVANEERGMFLISASTAGPEMYEVHASSKDERNTWMRLIREAVESCPEEEEEYTSESEEEKRTAEARTQKIYQIQESLMNLDQQICSSLEEKLQIYAELSAITGTMDNSLVEQRLLVQHHIEDMPQAALLLAAALQEAEKLRAILSPKTCLSLRSNSDPDADSVFSVSPFSHSEDPSVVEISPSDSVASEESWDKDTALEPLIDIQKKDIDLTVTQSVQSLTQLLYSLKAAVTLQDSCYEVQRLFLQENERPSPRAQNRLYCSSPRGNTLQEQEKQRNLEKRKEEVATAHRLQEQLRQEKEQWERECQHRESQQEEQERGLQERERQCHLEAERLKHERAKLEEQLEEYQQSLERLREGQRSVEKEREQLETQQNLQQWSLATVMPHMLIPLDGQQDPAMTQDPVFVNEASTSINNRHVDHRENNPSTHNCLNALLARSNSRRHPNAKISHADTQGWVMGTGYFYSPAGGLGLEHTPSDHNHEGCIGETWSSTAATCPVLPHPSEPLELFSTDTDSSGEEPREETIVYL